MRRLGYCIRRWKLEIRQFWDGRGRPNHGALSRASVAIRGNLTEASIRLAQHTPPTNFFFDAQEIGDLAGDSGDRISVRSESSRLSSSSFAINLFPLYSTHHRGSRKLAASRISKCKLTKLTIILSMVFEKLLSPRDHAPTGLPAYPLESLVAWQLSAQYPMARFHRLQTISD
jgi:hypothetical protein